MRESATCRLDNPRVLFCLLWHRYHTSHCRNPPGGSLLAPEQKAIMILMSFAFQISEDFDFLWRIFMLSNRFPFVPSQHISLFRRRNPLPDAGRLRTVLLGAPKNCIDRLVPDEAQSPKGQPASIVVGSAS